MDDQYEGFKNEFYEQFPPGGRHGFGPLEGFNEFVRLNDETLFTEDAKKDPVIQAFLKAPLIISYAQFKSSHRESEYWIHEPLQAMGNGVEGINGMADGLEPDTRIQTLILNHELTLARYITRSISVHDTKGRSIGQVVHKEEGPAE